MSIGFVPSQTMREFYSIEKQRADTLLPPIVKVNHTMFIRYFNAYQQNGQHEGFFYDSKVDGTEERVCSVCYTESPPATYKRELYADLPVLYNSYTTGISSCYSQACTKKIEAYILEMRQNVGPFDSRQCGALVQNTSYIDSFGGNRTNFDTLHIPADPDGWHFEKMHIRYSSRENDIEVIVDLARRNIGRFAYTAVPLRNIINTNPRIDWRVLSEEMPMTFGGDFVRNYIRTFTLPTPMPKQIKDRNSGSEADEKALIKAGSKPKVNIDHSLFERLREPPAGPIYRSDDRGVVLDLADSHFKSAVRLVVNGQLIEVAEKDS